MGSGAKSVLAWRVTKSCRPLLLVSTLHIVTRICSGGGKFLDTSRMCDVLYCAKKLRSAVCFSAVCAPMATIWFSILQNVTPLWKHEHQTQTLNVISANLFSFFFCPYFFVEKVFVLEHPARYLHLPLLLCVCVFFLNSGTWTDSKADVHQLD